MDDVNVNLVLLNAGQIERRGDVDSVVVVMWSILFRPALMNGSGYGQNVAYLGLKSARAVSVVLGVATGR
jgi:hypothetical protein